jgi:hypothetical protein
MGAQPDSYRLEVAWTDILTGVFRSDISLTDGPDVTPGSFGNNTFDDISADLLQVPLIERGCASDGGAMQMGRFEAVLNDPTGRYDPENPSSPLHGYLTPMRPIRYIETVGGVDYGQFYGFIEEITHDPDPDAQKSYIKAVDFFERLATKPVIAPTGPLTAGAAVGLVLDAREWTDASMRELDAGHNLADFSADGTKTSLQLIGDIQAVDLGSFVVKGSGVTAYQSLGSRYVRRDPVAVLQHTLRGGGKPSTSLRGIVNQITVTREGGSPQTASDPNSIQAYDVREGNAITSPLLVSDADAKALAEWQVLVSKDPRPPVKEVTIANRDSTNLALIASLEIGDYVEAVIDRAGNTVRGWIEHLRKSTSPGGAIRTATYRIRKKTLDLFTTDVSLTDSADVTGY